MKEIREIDGQNLSELILNKVNIIVVSSDAKGNINFISPMTEHISGYRLDELLGDKWWNRTFISSEEGQRYKQMICDVSAGKSALNLKPYERKFLCKDGSHKWIEWRNSTGENNSYVSVGIDITDWKGKEVFNNQSEAILNNVDSIVLVSKKNGDVIFASPSVEEMLGFKVAEIMGDQWWHVTYENYENAKSVRNAIHNYVYHKETDFTDITKQKIKTSSGSIKWVEWQITEGYNNTYISIGTDITDRILSEIELKKAKEAAEESLKVKNQFLANMSHEIRTPLNAVIGFTDLLLETQLNSEQREHLETMKNSGEILLTLINNVLDLSKLDSEKLEIENIPFDLHKSVKEVVKLMKIKSDAKHINMDLIIDPNTPQQVIGDPTRLGQIMLNLIGNAVKFTDEGSVLISVKMLSETNDSMEVYFEIKDTGIGIVSNKINTVFGAFKQAKSDTSRIYGGTGLGLTIVKKLVGALKGHIKVESQFGEGSVFKMVLPLQKGAEKVVEEKSSEEIHMEKPLGLNILLVEDNKTNQLLAKTRLERWDCTVDLANNGIEGVKKTQQKLYDVILMDIQMPIMDGYEATKIIKNDISDQVSRIPVIAMTAYASNADIKKARNSGMNDYIFKPFKPHELYAMLEKYGTLSSEEIKPNEIEKLKNDSRVSVAKKYVNLRFLQKETLGENSILVLLIELFINDFEEFLEIAEREHKNKNWKSLYEATHKIKPNISMFGISKMEPVIQKLVVKFREETALEDTGDLLESCKEIFKHVKEELLIELKTLGNG